VLCCAVQHPYQPAGAEGQALLLCHSQAAHRIPAGGSRRGSLEV
jgi:hypothetical protein